MASKKEWKVFLEEGEKVPVREREKERDERREMRGWAAAAETRKGGWFAGSWAVDLEVDLQVDHARGSSAGLSKKKKKRVPRTRKIILGAKNMDK